MEGWKVYLTTTLQQLIKPNGSLDNRTIPPLAGRRTLLSFTHHRQMCPLEREKEKERERVGEREREREKDRQRES